MNDCQLCNNKDAPCPYSTEVSSCLSFKELKQKIYNAKEIYTGMDGFNPMTAPEAYLQRILRQMYEELT